MTKHTQTRRAVQEEAWGRWQEAGARQERQVPLAGGPQHTQGPVAQRYLDFQRHIEPIAVEILDMLSKPHQMTLERQSMLLLSTRSQVDE